MSRAQAARVASVRSSKWLPHWLLAAAALGWALLVLVFYYRQIWQLLLGNGRDSLGIYIGPSMRLFAGMLLLFAAAFVFVLSQSVWRRRRGAAGRGAEGRGALLYVAAVALLGLAWLGMTFASARLTIDPALPYWGDALRRHLAGLGGASVLLLAAGALGLGILRLAGWRSDCLRERVAFGSALGIGIFAYLGLALALAGLYRPLVLQVIVALVVVGAVVVAVQARRRGLHLAAPRLPQGAPRLWIACAALALFCSGLAALAPESQFDAVWYHLAYPQRYLQAGSLVDIPWDFVSLYPMTAELWFGYGLALGGATAAILLHSACLVLSAVITYEIARRYAPGASPWLAVALLVTGPTVIWEASTSYVDLFMMLFITLAFYALLRYRETLAGPWLVLAALNLGFALASKHLGLFALTIFCPGLLLALLLRKVPWQRALGAAFVLGVLSLLVASPWYLRSYLATGNPIFETMFGLFGAPPERWNAQTEAALRRFLTQFGRPHTLANTLTLPWDMTIHAASYDGSLGPLFLILLPSLALRRLRPALPSLLGFVALFMLLWATPLASFELRHLMPITPALAVLGASAFGRATALARSAANRRAPAMLAAGLAALMLLNFPPFTFLHEGDRVEWNGWLTSVLHTAPLGVVIGGESVDDYLSRRIASYPIWQFADETLPADSRILTYSEGENFYTRDNRLWANSALVVATAWAPAGQEEQALARLRELGITHVIVDERDPDSPAGWDSFAVTGAVARAQWYEQLHAEQGYVLYRIRWEELGGR